MQPEKSIIDALVSYGPDRLWEEFSEAVLAAGDRFASYASSRRYMLLAYITGCDGPMGYDLEIDEAGIPQLAEWYVSKALGTTAPPNFYGTELQAIAESIVQKLKLTLLKKLQKGELIATATHQQERRAIPRAEWKYLQLNLKINSAAQPDQDVHYFRLDIRERHLVLSDALSKSKFIGPNRRGAKNRTAPYVDAFFEGVSTKKWPAIYSKAVGRQLLELELPETIGKKRPDVDSLRKAIRDDDRYLGPKE